MNARALGAALLALAAPLTSAAPNETALARLERAFPEQPRWQRPLWFGAVPAAEGAAADAPRLHVLAEQHGVAHAFELDARGVAGAPRELLDIASRTCRVGNEEGLLGLAFHPGVAANGRVFVHYSVRGAQKGRLSEFRWPKQDGAIDASSERILTEIEQPYRNHNGGEIVFGPDGCLYWGLGDGGAAGDPQQNGQSMSTWLGKILRIDVGPTAPAADAPAYLVPRDNPFVDRAGARPEIWALGLRNPWRFSFDPNGGALWCGDVGQNAEEEIDVIVRGGNYGWRVREGKRAYDADARRGPGELVEPVILYPRDQGWSVTGGFVYRGAKIAALRGHYVYGDYVSGRQWAWPVEGKADRVPLVLPKVDAPASYGVDAWGELYVCSFDGRIHRFVAAEAK
ncbi:MAG: glucose sorbosone dehydrogenase [Planctomycetota bacterium]|nr:MAG: glucose sorbosone dehydrogenase [Planctomycetota bacterium]